MIKREKDFHVKEISNGFIVTASGRNEDDEWVTKELYVGTLQALYDHIQGWYSMPIID